MSAHNVGFAFRQAQPGYRKQDNESFDTTPTAPPPLPARVRQEGAKPPSQHSSHLQPTTLVDRPITSPTKFGPQTSRRSAPTAGGGFGSTVPREPISKAVHGSQHLQQFPTVNEVLPRFAPRGLTQSTRDRHVPIRSGSFHISHPNPPSPRLDQYLDDSGIRDTIDIDENGRMTTVDDPRLEPSQDISLFAARNQQDPMRELPVTAVKSSEHQLFPIGAMSLSRTAHSHPRPFPGPFRIPAGHPGDQRRKTPASLDPLESTSAPSHAISHAEPSGVSLHEFTMAAEDHPDDVDILTVGPPRQNPLSATIRQSTQSQRSSRSNGQGSMKDTRQQTQDAGGRQNHNESHGLGRTTQPSQTLPAELHRVPRPSASSVPRPMSAHGYASDQYTQIEQDNPSHLPSHASIRRSATAIPHSDPAPNLDHRLPNRQSRQRSVSHPTPYDEVLNMSFSTNKADAVQGVVDMAENLRRLVSVLSLSGGDNSLLLSSSGTYVDDDIPLILDAY